jgi:hypothetical protein
VLDIPRHPVALRLCHIGHTDCAGFHFPLYFQELARISLQRTARWHSPRNMSGEPNQMLDPNQPP